MLDILFFSSDIEDYLADSLLHGLKNLKDVNVTDYPKVEIMYRNHNGKYPVRGKGFSLYHLLQDDSARRYGISEKIFLKKYDLVIFSSIHRQFGFLLQFYPFLDSKKTIIIDGEDSPSIFPYQGQYWRNPRFWFLPRVHKKFVYYKRELTPETLSYRYYKLLPVFFAKFLPIPKNLRKIAFSIPEEKIVEKLPAKNKLFARHIVDPEVARFIGNSSTSYVFDTEKDYYNDIQASKFAVTTKRSGWDCMRHYEIAANGAVPCFRDLDKKPETCAPHGLNPSNSISYSSYSDLMSKIEKISEESYVKLQSGALEWARRNTTKMRAKQLLESFL